jgi:hypothetical protein
MMVSHEFQFAYLRPPKTATTAISKAMRQFYKAFVVAPHEDQGHQTRWMPEFSGYYTFIVVRNPFPRMASLWRQARKQPKRREPKFNLLVSDGNANLSFRDFVLAEKRQEWLRGRRCYHYQLDVPHVHRVVHQENLHVAIHQLPFVRRDLQLAQDNKSHYDRPWWEEYDDETIQRVRELWADDFQAYNYRMTFEEALP